MQDLKCILHVDDDTEILELTNLALGLVGGFEVHQFDKGEDALKHITDINPDLLLLDVMMPNMDGPELLSAIRKVAGFEDVPAIFMTARSNAKDDETLSVPGVLGSVAKPFDPIALPEELKRIWMSQATLQGS